MNDGEIEQMRAELGALRQDVDLLKTMVRMLSLQRDPPSPQMPQWPYQPYYPWPTTLPVRSGDLPRWTSYSTGLGPTTTEETK